MISGARKSCSRDRPYTERHCIALVIAHREHMSCRNRLHKTDFNQQTLTAYISIRYVCSLPFDYPCLRHKRVGPTQIMPFLPNAGASECTQWPPYSNLLQDFCHGASCVHGKCQGAVRCSLQNGLQDAMAVPVSCMQGCIVKRLAALQGGKRGRAPEMSAGPLILEPIGKVGCPVLTCQICP